MNADNNKEEWAEEWLLVQDPKDAEVRAVPNINARAYFNAGWTLLYEGRKDRVVAMGNLFGKPQQFASRVGIRWWPNNVR